MSSTADTTSSKSTAASLRRYVGVLPVVNQTVPMDERSAQSARSILEQADPAWGSRLKSQIDHIVQDLAVQLDYDSKSGRYAITGTELRGIVARAVSQSSGQTAVDIGQALTETPLATTQFTVMETDSSDDSILVKNYKQPELQQGF